jgi:nucleoid DNA-binding protein
VAMAELKTQLNKASITDFVAKIADDASRADCRALIAMMKDLTGEPARMWGASIVGFGTYRYRYATGREGDWFLTGFSPRKQNLTLYIMAGFGAYPELMKTLGRYKTAKSCLYVKRLDDLHLPTLKKLIRESVKHTRKVDAKNRKS